MIHILFSHAAKATFTQAFEDTILPFSGEVFVFEPYLQIGILSDEDLRLKQLSQAFGAKSDQSEREALKNMLSEQADTINNLINHQKKIIFWLGEEAADELAFMYLLSKLELARGSFSLQVNRVRGPLLVRELPPERLEAYFNPVELTNDAISQLQKSWELVKEKESDLRVRQADFIFEHHSFHHYDPIILSNIKDYDIDEAAALVGEMYGKIPHLPFPFFLWRLYVLHDMKLIDWIEKDDKQPMSGKIVLKS
ncbi:DUF1835 domain-containing protein [Alkalihalophilus marmarensis]|jgi:hypothetical protein|uniref:DUF1835 domain-containing protein n=1 Tax=Alkalihalophilus marmarensis TaxID=521377 RepID=UPI00203BD399|nr:DUF3658 domain-containing protein [Alkalihalophilus marmarensis]MCM3490294.1 DUF1835 domain-containing protein [Alkalihalophilus marmarensis]